jgi:hypothetical protein
MFFENNFENGFIPRKWINRKTTKKVLIKKFPMISNLNIFVENSECIFPRKWLNWRTNGTIRKCSSRPFHWMVKSVGSDINLNFWGNFCVPPLVGDRNHHPSMGVARILKGDRFLKNPGLFSLSISEGGGGQIVFCVADFHGQFQREVVRVPRPPPLATPRHSLKN